MRLADMKTAIDMDGQKAANFVQRGAKRTLGELSGVLVVNPP